MHSYTSSLCHCIFATKNREPLLTSDLRARLWPYLGGIARENGMKTLAIGGVADHVHILLGLPATMALAKAIQLLKGNSSKWIHETFPLAGCSSRPAPSVPAPDHAMPRTKQKVTDNRDPAEGEAAFPSRK